MDEKYNPPHIDEDFTEEEFDRLLESKFGLQDDLFSDDQDKKKQVNLDKTPTPVSPKTSLDDTAEVILPIVGSEGFSPQGQEEEPVVEISGDPYDYTIPETREAWGRLKARVDELEEVNQDLRNQLDLSAEIEATTGVDEEELTGLRRQLALVTDELDELKKDKIPELMEENRVLTQRLSQLEQENESMHREKELLTQGLEREQGTLSQEIESLKSQLTKAAEDYKTLMDSAQNRERELTARLNQNDSDLSELNAEMLRLTDDLQKTRRQMTEAADKAAEVLAEKEALLDKKITESEQEHHSTILALQKEKKVIMDELKEQHDSLQRYVSELEKEREDRGQIQDQLSMKVGLLEDEKETFKNQNLDLTEQNKKLSQELKEIKNRQEKKREDLKQLTHEMIALFDQP